MSSKKRKTAGFGKMGPYGGTSKQFPRSMKTSMSKYNATKSRASVFTPGSQMRQAAGTETKVMDTIIGPGGIVATPMAIVNVIAATPANSIQCLNLVQAGAAFNNRIGNRIRMKSVQIKGHIRLIDPSLAGYAKNSLCRIMLLYDRQPNKAIPAFTDIVASFRQEAPGPVLTAVSGLNMENRDRFLILRDAQIILPCGSGGGPAGGPVISDPNINSGSPQGSFNINWFVKLKGSVAHYLGTADPATIALLTEGALLLTAFDEQGLLLTPRWEFGFSSRLKFLE